MPSRAFTQTSYHRPYRPLAVAAYNRVMGWQDPARVFEPDQLFDAAARAAGTSELSDAPLMEPLERLCEALRNQARLSPMGAMIQSLRLKTLITNRLRLDRILRENPEIEKGPEPEVILIAGLARTGTTLLHRTLGADPDARTLPSWEAVNPAPFPNEPDGVIKKRLRQGKLANQMIHYLAPDFAAVHPVAYDQPEEDILLLDLTMMSQTAESVTHVPDYSDWLETQNHLPAYAYLRKTLMVLNYFRPGRHWVLKSPHHSEHLAAAFETFPQMTLIQTHRDPMKTMPSCCSLMAHTQGLSSDHVDPHAIGSHWLKKSKLMADNAIAARRLHSKRPAIDILYRDLVANPIGEINRIYDLRGQQPPIQVITAATRAMRQPATSVKVKHRYALSDFALSEDAIIEAFADYVARYDIPSESA